MEISPELIQGPVPKWEHSSKDRELINRLLLSDNDLERAYGEAYSSGCFVTEFGGDDEIKGITAVGELDNLAVVEFRLGKKLDMRELSMGACIELGAHPATGDNRAERVREALRQVLDARKNNRR